MTSWHAVLSGQAGKTPKGMYDHDHARDVKQEKIIAEKFC